MARNYALAVVGLIRKGVDLKRVLVGLDAMLERKHHQKLRPTILREAVKLLRMQHEATIRVASKKVAKSHERELQEFAKKYDLTDTPRIIEDATLIGGYMLETNNIRIDQSYKRVLVDLYRNIVTN